MIVALLCTVAVLVVANGAALALCARRREPRGLGGRTLLVNGTDGTTWRGVVVADHADRVSLSQAVVVTVAGEHAADGLVHIPRPGIAWMQEPGVGAGSP